MLKIYNTLSRNKEDFKTMEPNTVKMYVCGITTYNTSHIGHARSDIAFDIIRKYLLHLGYNVSFAKNYTDIDDKIIHKAISEKTTFQNISERYIKKHQEFAKQLNVMPPTVAPRATEHIGNIISFIEELINKGFAYPSQGDVYFRVNKFAEYGKLSNRNLDDITSGEGDATKERKESELDFALWKGAKEGEPSWETAWGDGRPGWHIECSAMIRSELGGSIDIHGGGLDLVFPHHENEIAQSESLGGNPLASYWMHNGLLTVNGVKMSKSLGNFITVDAMLEQFHPEVIRLFFAKTHYRSSLNYSVDLVIESERSLTRLYNYLAETNAATAVTKGVDATSEVRSLYSDFASSFTSAMDDDFNTPLALASLFTYTNGCNSILNGKLNAATLMLLQESNASVVATVSSILGVLAMSPVEFFHQIMPISESELQDYISRRNDARKSKDFATSDEIRDTLAEMGIMLMDTASGTHYFVSKVRGS